MSRDSQPTSLPKLPEEVKERVAAQLEKTRAVMREFVGDASIAHRYSQDSSWRTFVSAANGDFLAGMHPYTQISMMGRLIDGTASRLIANNSPSLPKDQMADHTKFERKKASHKLALYHAAWELAKVHPGETPKVKHDRVHFEDEMHKAKRWVDSIGKPKARYSPAQHSLFPNG